VPFFLLVICAFANEGTALWDATPDTLTGSAVSGEITLTASEDLFAASSDEGVLFELTG
jgi:hypothetical protein